MHPSPEPDESLDALARAVVDSAFAVHRELGPGFFESVYEEAMDSELTLRAVPFDRQSRFIVRYKGKPVGEGRVDLLVGARLVVELKATEQIGQIHFYQLKSYMRALGCRLGLLINFNAPFLRQGIRRLIDTPK